MLNVRATGDTTSLDMVGSPSDLATELARVVQHVCARLITHVNPEDRQELAGTLAAGMTLAVKQAYKEVMANEAENG